MEATTVGYTQLIVLLYQVPFFLILRTFVTFYGDGLLSVLCREFLFGGRNAYEGRTLWRDQIQNTKERV